ncbi:hypothetical protein BB560_005270 [Smittium megazygosporum]|uniref:Uncharacterized protein n=1 Tax=Smittium megazygosporum TaxID=133381 RepID=A0A2T9Z6Y3_9FUNG|nr:hypothetical protein BB560_005270 [Smittium megazygosporum]
MKGIQDAQEVECRTDPKALCVSVTFGDYCTGLATTDFFVQSIEFGSSPSRRDPRKPICAESVTPS